MTSRRWAPGSQISAAAVSRRSCCFAKSAVGDDAASVSKGFGPKGNRELKLTVLSPRTATPLWERPLNNVDPIGFLGRVVSSDWDWPAIVDLDGKEKTAIVVPFVDYKSHASGVELLDGGTGESRLEKAARTDFAELATGANLSRCRRAGPGRRRPPRAFRRVLRSQVRTGLRRRLVRRDRANLVEQPADRRLSQPTRCTPAAALVAAWQRWLAAAGGRAA